MHNRKKKRLAHTHTQHTSTETKEVKRNEGEEPLLLEECVVDHAGDVEQGVSHAQKHTLGRHCERENAWSNKSEGSSNPQQQQIWESAETRDTKSERSLRNKTEGEGSMEASSAVPKWTN